jgi:Cytochrome P450.
MRFSEKLSVFLLSYSPLDFWITGPLLNLFKKSHRLNVPGPSWLPVVGCYLEFSRLLSKFKYHYLVCENYARRYGPITGLRLGRDRIILVSGFKAVREVLTRDEFDGRPSGYFFRLRALGRRLGKCGPGCTERHC